MRKPKLDYLRFPGVTPCMDISAHKKNAAIFINSTPDKYEEWLVDAIHKISIDEPNSPKPVFGNEWAEANHLEPDQKWGHSYLQATLNPRTNPDKDRHAIRRITNPLNAKTYLNHIFNRYIG